MVSPQAFEFNKPEVVEASAGPDCCLCGAPFADEEVQALALRAHPTMPPPQVRRTLHPLPFLTAASNVSRVTT